MYLFQWHGACSLIGLSSPSESDNKPNAESTGTLFAYPQGGLETCGFLESQGPGAESLYSLESDKAQATKDSAQMPEPCQNTGHIQLLSSPVYISPEDKLFSFLWKTQ